MPKPTAWRRTWTSVVNALKASIRLARLRLADLARGVRDKGAAVLLQTIPWLVGSLTSASRVISIPGNIGLSSLGLAAAVLLFERVDVVRHFQHFDTVLVGIGALIGTMMALVFSLAIIPMQQAATTMTTTIISLYRRDAVPHLVFTLLGTFSLACFAFSIDGLLPIPQTHALGLAVAMLGVSLDLLRWHHRRMTQLLVPSWAIVRLSQEISTDIARLRRRVNLAARLQFWLGLFRDDKLSIEDIESIYYSQLSNHRARMLFWSDELGEAALRALSRGEEQLVKAAVTALANQAVLYLVARRNSLRLRMEAPMVFGADIHDILGPLYERLQDVNRRATHLKSETASVQVIQAFEVVARHTGHLKSKAFRERESPLSWLPIAHLDKCATAAQVAGLDEAALQASRSLTAIVVDTPDDLQITDVHVPAIAALHRIALTFLLAGKGALASTTGRELMAIAHSAVERNHFEAAGIVETVLEKIAALVPMALKLPEAAALSLAPPLSPPYDLGDRLSIGYLLERAARGVNEEPEPGGRRAAARDRAMSEAVYRHFRHLAEEVDFRGSFLFWHIARTIKHIVGLYLRMLRAHEDDWPYAKDFEDRIGWHLAFFWVLFSKAKTIKQSDALEAADVLAWTALWAIQAERPRIAEACGESISSIAESVFTANTETSPYHAADLLIAIYRIRRLAEARGYGALVERLDVKRDAALDVLDERRWLAVEEALERRQEQVEEELAGYDRVGISDNSRTLLRRLLEGDGAQTDT